MDFTKEHGRYVRAPMGLTQAQVWLMLLVARAKTPEDEEEVHRYVMNISVTQIPPMRVLIRTGHLRVEGGRKKRITLTKAGIAWLEYLEAWRKTPLPQDP